MKIEIVKLKQLAVMAGIALSSIGGSGAVTPANALTFKMLINHTTNNGGSATPYLDQDAFGTTNGDNNSIIVMSNANAKALGWINSNPSEVDAKISFSSDFAWDFDRSNGISGGHDFVGVAAHEIGHALVFLSGVDVLDSPSADGLTHDENYFSVVHPLDLFRYSALSSLNNNGGAIDFTADSRDKYFSLDGGATKIASFSRGVNFGDLPCTPTPGIVCPQPHQASHWEDNLGIDIMDPTAAPGEKLAISQNDLRAFDVIGWNRSAAS